MFSVLAMHIIGLGLEQHDHIQTPVSLMWYKVVCFRRSSHIYIYNYIHVYTLPVKRIEHPSTVPLGLSPILVICVLKHTLLPDYLGTIRLC